jgi:predicted GNAT family acetyltransferase
MSIHVERFDSATAMRAVAEPLLMRNEAENALLLGLLGTLELNPGFYGADSPYLAAAVQGSDVVGVALMTPPRAVVLSQCKTDAATALAQDVLAFRRGTSGVNGPLPASHEFAEAWQALTGEAFDQQLSERCYKLEHLRPPSGVSGSTRLAAEKDAELVTDWRMAFTAEAVPFDAASRDEIREYVLRQLNAPRTRVGTVLWEDGGRPVSMATYGGATPNAMRIGGVYTPSERRGRGYASACTAAACQEILTLGKSFVTLYTDLANATTNHIYQEIGFQPVGDAALYAFRR